MKTAAILLVILAVFGICHSAPLEDEVTQLPGLTFPINFTHYSGYLTGDQGEQLHYWFTESSRDPLTDPVLLWLNGGPGCSSIEGLLDELGPFHVNPDGQTLYENIYSWNTVANVLFLEAPACVGFSYNPKYYCLTNDDETSLSNYIALQDFFFNKFPEYNKHDFYITGESYAGIYVPTLAVRVLNGQQESPINLKGFAVGNGLLSYQMNDDSLIFFGYHHGLYGKALWTDLIDNCCTDGLISNDTCTFSGTYSMECRSAVQQTMKVIYSSGLNIYSLYLPCLQSGGQRVEMDLANLFRKHPAQSYYLQKAKEMYRNVKSDPPCMDTSHIKNYLNTPEVKEALHIPANVTAEWTICSDLVGGVYERQYQDMKEQYDFLTKTIRALVYNGDTDMACNFLGDEWFVDSLGLKVLEKTRPWHHDGQIAGYVKRFNNLDFVTALGAGHMVPQEKPAASLQMIKAFLFREPY